MFQDVERQQLKVPAHIDYLGDLRDFVTKIGRKHKFSDKVVNAFKLSLDEAATNIIRHAYRESDGLITIRAIVKKNSLTLIIIDQGMYFDPKRVKDPDLNRYIDIGKKGGLGIFIMRKLMDEIDYRKTEEGNELRITKYREQPTEKKLFKSVSAIPFSIKAKFFFRAIAVITLIIAVGYFYFFLKTDDDLLARFMADSHATNRTIVNLIGQAKADEFGWIEDIIVPIEEEYQSQIDRITAEDSLGLITYSTNTSEIASPFVRPANAEQISPSVYKYELINAGEVFYEFETPLVIKELGLTYGKTHIFFSATRTENQISAMRLDSLQFALLILAMSYVGVALLIYIVMNPLRKLSEWIKTLGQGEEIEDEVDIDASSELGEIARAFSDIQSKFRDSQRNLADQERLQKEMQVAQEIQQTLLPMEFPVLEGYELGAYYEAAKEVGGDYYDFVEVDKDTLGIAVADVSGKGVPGSLVMTMIRTALRTEARGIKDAAEVLARVNSFVSNDIKKGMFVTVFYLIIDSKKRCLNYASAGHNPMILYRGSTQQTYYLNPKGFPIGIQLPDRDYFRKYIESDTIQLTKDDILLLYTDGITEAMNSYRELYGEERLQKVLNDYGDLPVTQFVERLKDSIYSFTEGSPQYDDITLVAVKEESTRQEDELRRAQEVHRLTAEGMSVKEACEEVNITTYLYYNKYKKVFDEVGIDGFEIADESISVEAKHLSIEEKTKIFDIIHNYPEFGAARIRDELNTEKYAFTQLSENRIYDELVRSRLNTKALREAFVARAKRNRRKIKAPGTPFMTLDGQIVIKSPQVSDHTLPDFRSTSDKHSRTLSSTPARPVEPRPEDSDDAPGIADTSGKDTVISDFEAEALIDSPIEELLANPDQDLIDYIEVDEVLGGEESGLRPGTTEIEAHPGDDDFSSVDEDSSLLDDFSFEELFEEGSGLESDDEIEFASEPAVAEQSSLYEAEPQEQPELHETIEPSPELAVDETDSQENREELSVEENDDLLISDAVADEDSTLTATSIEELLEAPGLDDESELSELEKESKLEPVSPAKTTQATEENDDTVSFSDLIQAIDEEIVYVTEPNSAPPKEAYAEPDFLEPDPTQLQSGSTENGVETSQNGNGAPKVKQDVGFAANEDKETILISGIKHYKNNEYDKAITEFRRVIGVFPDYKEAHSILGNAYFRNKMYNEAAIEYQRVKELDPEDITAYENMGVIYANRGEYRQAVGEWKKVIELSPNRTDIEDKIRKALRLI